MANPRQRRKARSSTHRPVRSTSARSLRKKPPVKGPKILQEMWDARKTVRQNYAALGLIADVNARENAGQLSGTLLTQTLEPENVGPPSADASTSGQGLAKGTGRILRDADGTVVGVALASDDDEGGDDPKRRLTEGHDAPMAGNRDVVPVLAKTGTVRALEAAVARAAARTRRPPSMHQHKWLRELVGAYGTDVEAMARDRKLNPWLWTPGQLRRAVAHLV